MKKHPAYKDSGIDWIGLIPEDWSIAKIKYKATLSPKVKFEQTEYNTKVSFLPMEYIKNGYFVPNSAELVNNNSSYCSFENGDIVLAKVTPCFENGNIAIMENLENELGFGSSELFVLRTRGIDTRFLFYHLQSSYFIQQGISIMTGAGGLKRISSNFLNNYMISLPSNEKQRTISLLLDKKTEAIGKIITEKQRLIELLKEKRQAIITQAVTKGLDVKVPMKDSGNNLIGEIPEHWGVAKIKYISASPLLYGANESGDSEESDDPRYIRITDIDDDGNLKKGTFKSLSRELAKSYMLNKGDILFARSGATVGKSYIHIEDIEACFAGYLIKLSTNREVAEPKFIYYHTKSNIYDNWIKQNTIQATIQNVSAEKYNNYVVTLPSLTEQKKIANYLDGINAEIDRNVIDLFSQVEKLKEYRQSIISEAVTGKVVV